MAQTAIVYWLALTRDIQLMPLNPPEHIFIDQTQYFAPVWIVGDGKFSPDWL